MPNAAAIGHYHELDPQIFDIAHDVPVFCEHEVVERDQAGGKRIVRYDRATLEAMVENMNARIRDTGDYTALCLGHTPTPEQKAKGMPMPKLVGFAGPYYVGSIGDQKPRWAICARNYATFKSDADEVRRYPRRSPEVYEEPNPADRYFDPIALLGAQMPHLDLGLAYSRASHGKLIRRYSAAAAACPGAANTFVPGEEASGRKTKPIETNPTRYQEDSSLALDQTDIDQIVNAFSQTSEMQWIRDKMKAEQGKGDLAEGADGAVAGGDEGAAWGAPGAQYAAEGARAPESTNPQGAAPTAAAAAPAKKLDDLTRMQQYSRQRADVARYERMESENDALKKRIDAIEGHSRKVTRYARLEQLSYQHAFDLEEEVKDTLELADDAFERHCDRIVKRYQRIPVGLSFVEVSRSEPLAGREAPVTYEQRVAAVDLVARYEKSGEKVSFDKALAEIRGKK